MEQEGMRMRQCCARLVTVGTLVLAAFVAAAPSVSAVTAKGTPTKIVATGTLPPSPAPTFGAPAADGSLPFTATYQMVGDLTGQVTGTGTMTIDNVAKTYTQHETTGTFVGTLRGVGPVTLTFVTTIPTTALTAAARESGSATGSGGKVKGYRGTIVNTFTVEANGPGAGTYTVKLRKKK
jgi:hypothetical protein